MPPSKARSSSWSPLESGVSAHASVRALTVYNGSLIAGGAFTQAGEEPANFIARWDGSAWSALGSGIGGGANTWVGGLAVYDGRLIAGGNFDAAGGQPASAVADCIDDMSAAGRGHVTSAFVPKVFPNPTSGPCCLSFRLPSAGLIHVQVVDMGGRVVRRLLSGPRPAVDYSLTWDGRDDLGRRLPAGVYLTWLQTPAGVTTGRIVRIN